MNRASPDYFRRPAFCPHCAAGPLPELPEIYLQLMFAERSEEAAANSENEPDQLVA